MDFSNLRISLRGLVKTPAFTIVTVLTLAVAIGATTAIFSVIDGVLFHALPYPNADRLVRVAARTLPQAGLASGQSPFSDRGYWHFVNNNRAFEKFGGFQLTASADQPDQWALTGAGEPIMVDVGRLTASAFELLGVKPQRGRLPTAEEDVPGGPRVVVLSDELWRTAFGSDPSIIGRLIELNSARREVIGVLPAGFEFPLPKTDVWVPYQLNPASENFGSHSIGGIARLRPDVTIEAATVDAESLISRFKEVGYNDSWFTNIFSGKASVRTFKDDIVGNARRPLWIVLGTMGFVLLVACSNIANLLLVRTESRTRDSAIQMALGSGRRRLVRFVLTEGMVLALTGGLAGTLLAYAGIRVLVALAPASIPRLNEIGLNLTVLAFTAGISIVAGLLFSLLPALRAGSPRSLSTVLNGTGRSGSMGQKKRYARSVLVITQVALALVLFVGAGLMVRSFGALRGVDPGFKADGVLTFRLSPSIRKYESNEAAPRFYDELLNRLRALPGVSAAGTVTFLPLNSPSGAVATRVEEFPVPQGQVAPSSSFRRGAPGYFETMGIPLIEGRTFTSDDHNNRLGSMIISKAVKDKYWPNVSALGKRITIAGEQGTVVGVVGNVRSDLRLPPDQTIYKPMLDKKGGRTGQMYVVVRTQLDPESISQEVRKLVASMDPDLPVTDIRPMQSIVADSLSRTSFTMVLLALAAGIALFIGAVGIYGVIASSVTQRTGEIGLRQALGADRSTILRLIVWEGIQLCLLGIALGLAGAASLGGVLSSLLFRVGPHDVATLIGSSVIFFAVAAAATAVPATRATKIAPAVALKVD